MSRGKVIVIGGGLAGITAALRCADRGYTVRLLEGRALLGGATYSFSRGELTADTGQHVVLRCYTHYLDLLRRLGVLEGVALQERFRIPLVSPHRQTMTLRRWNMPAPAHLLPAMLGNTWLTLRERTRVARTALALRRLDPTDPELDAISLGDWLRRRNETDQSIRTLWGLLAVAALNTNPDDASLALAVKVFRTGLLDATENIDIGVPRIPLRQLHGDPAKRALVAAGVRVDCNTRVRSLIRVGDRLQVTSRYRGEHAALEADHVVLAVPHQQAAVLMADLPVHESISWSGLSAAPIVNVHVHYDRRVTRHEMCAVLDSPVQWVFDRTAVAGASKGQYLALSESAAWEFAYARTDELRAKFLPELERVFPAAGHARVLDFFVTREPSATFHQTPGTAALRPRTRTAVPGLMLAGAWTATGWPDTIEGAVVSGVRAAEAVEADERPQQGMEVTA